MEPRTQTSAGMETVNETVERAKAMVSTSSDTQAPSVSTLEAAPQPLKMPEPANFQPVEIPTFSFLSETSEMKNAKAQTEKQRGNLNMVGNDLYAQMLGIGTQEGEQAKFEQQLGVDAVQVRKTDIENEILQKNNRFLRENEQIMRGTGTTMGQKQAQLNEAQRKQAVDLTDLEIRYQAVTSSLNNISAIAKRKAEIVFGDKKAKVDALKFIYDENKELLTDQEDKLFQKTLLREGKALDIQVKQYQDFEEERLRYLNNAAQAGADNNTLKTIQGAKSLDELYGMQGIQKYSMSQAEKLDMAYKNAQIANLYDQINARGVEAYEAQIKAAVEAKEQADAGLQKSLAGAALALELQTADGLSSAIGFGIKKNAVSRTTAGAGTGAAIGAGLGSVVPIVGTAAGGVVGGIVGGVTGFFTSPEAIAGTARADYETKADQLAAMITLEGRSALRGQGTITDSEQALLARAETILSNKDVSEEVWLATLQQTAQILNNANKEYARLYGGIPAELGSIYGIGADGLPAGASLQIDGNGNVIIPGSSQIISNEDFFSR